MVEAAEQYKARLAAYVEGKDPVAMQSQAPRTLARLIDVAAETKLSLKPAPSKWSVTGRKSWCRPAIARTDVQWRNTEPLLHLCRHNGYK